MLKTNDVHVTTHNVILCLIVFGLCSTSESDSCHNTIHCVFPPALLLSLQKLLHIIIYNVILLYIAHLSEDADLFQKRATQMRRKFWWQNFKVIFYCINFPSIKRLIMLINEYYLH